MNLSPRYLLDVVTGIGQGQGWPGWGYTARRTPLLGGMTDGEEGGMSAEGSAMKDIVVYILGALTTVATQVVSNFFGSNAGSADKSKTLDALAKRESTG